MRKFASILCAAALFQGGSLNAQSAPSATPQPGQTTYDVDIHLFGKNKRAPVHYELVNGLILFEANVAGRDVWTLLDNGAERSVIDAGLAREAGFTIGEPEGTITTPTGELPKRRVSDVPIVIPGQMKLKTPLAAIDLDPFSVIAGRDIQAIFGGEFLGQLILIVDTARQTFQLVPSGALKSPPPIPMVPLHGSKPQVELSVGGERLLLTIDMGMSGDMSLTPDAWERVGPKDAKFTSRGIAHAEGQLFMEDHARLPMVKIGPIEQTAIDVSVRPWPDERGDGMLGMGFLNRFDFVMDIKAGKLWLVPRIPSSAVK